MFMKRTRHTEPEPVRLQLVPDDGDPDTVVVLVEEAPVPQAIRVIPTQRARVYWTHPSQDHD